MPPFAAVVSMSPSSNTVFTTSVASLDDVSVELEPLAELEPAELEPDAELAPDEELELEPALELELDGYFQCKKGETDYTIPLARHFSKGPKNYDFPYCEAVRYNAYIGPDGKLAPCMGFSDTVLKDRFPSVLKEHLGQLSLNGYYNDLVNTKLSDLLNKNEECRTCPHLNSCLGGCMLEGMDDEGDFLHPDPHSCFFHKHVGEEAIRKIADEAIEKYCK